MVLSLAAIYCFVGAVSPVASFAAVKRAECCGIKRLRIQFRRQMITAEAVKHIASSTSNGTDDLQLEMEESWICLQSCHAGWVVATLHVAEIQLHCSTLASAVRDVLSSCGLTLAQAKMQHAQHFDLAEIEVDRRIAIPMSESCWSKMLQYVIKVNVATPDPDATTHPDVGDTVQVKTEVSTCAAVAYSHKVGVVRNISFTTMSRQTCLVSFDLGEGTKSEWFRPTDLIRHENAFGPVTATIEHGLLVPPTQPLTPPLVQQQVHMKRGIREDQIALEMLLQAWPLPNRSLEFHEIATDSE